MIAERTHAAPASSFALLKREAHLNDRLRAASRNGAARSEEAKSPALVNVFNLAIWLMAGVVPFIPFAWASSPWDALTYRLLGNGGDYWHILIGVPFFLAYPMIWLRLRAVFSTQLSTPLERRLIWSAVGCSVACTILVHVPYLLHLAGESGDQRLAVPSLIFGLVASSAIAALLLRRPITPTRACLVGLDAAYLANATLCLIMFREPGGLHWWRVGWLMSVVLYWPILFELIWLLVQTSRAKGHKSESKPAEELISA